MPYITADRRQDLDAGGSPQHCGELNYCITMLMIGYLKRKGISYQTLNDISGAATEALAEFRRRVVANYEDQKVRINGDIY